MTPNTNPSPSIEYARDRLPSGAAALLYEFDPRADSLPKRIDPALVDRVLQEELSKGLPKRQPASQMVALANFLRYSVLCLSHWPSCKGTNRATKNSPALPPSLPWWGCLAPKPSVAADEATTTIIVTAMGGAPLF